MCSIVYYGFHKIESKSPKTLKVVFYFMGYIFLLILPFISTFAVTLVLLGIMIAVSVVTIGGFDWILLATKIFLYD